MGNRNHQQSLEFGAMSVFLNDAENFGLDERLILDCFGEPDD